MADTVQLIKEKLSIADVVTPYVKLTRSGKYLKGLSPFNKEKTPSFFVNPERGSYYCFSTNQGGDMFTFIEKMEGVDFKGALKILAEKAGVEVEYGGSGKQNREASDRLREAMARAEQYFAQNLTEDSSAYAYALSRGLLPKTISTWRLGFAPDGWRGLLEELSKAGYSVAELSAAGLVKEAEGKSGTYYDRFRNRLMFPIRDAAGRTVAFTGRALEAGSREQGAVHTETQTAKYLNSPETELFKKSHILFAMDRAKDAIRTRGFALLMEGQLDVIHAHQAGFENAIALSGTALSPEHVALIKRYTDNLMLCLDADRAGLDASFKHALSALAAGMRVKAVRLPKERDPADLIKEDAKEFTQRVKEAKSIVEFFLAVLSESATDSHRLVLQTERVVLPLLAAIKSPMEREHFVPIVSRAIASTDEAVREGLKVVNRRQPTGDSDTKAETTKVSERVSDEVLFRAIVTSYPDTLLAKRVESEYSRIIGRPLGEEVVPAHVEFSTGILFGETPPEHAADDTLKRFEKVTLERQYALSVAALRSAEREGKESAIREAEAECARLAKALSALP